VDFIDSDSWAVQPQSVNHQDLVKILWSSRGYGPLCYFDCFPNQCQEKEVSVGSEMPTVELLIGWSATKQSEIFNTRICRGSTFERKWKGSNDFKEHTKSKQHEDACEAKAAAASTQAAREG
jgi:hypothetical protein